MSRPKFITSITALAALFYTPIAGYAQPRTRELTITLFGRTAHLNLSVGTLGLTIILILAVLLAVVAILAALARHRATQAEVANRKLEREIGERKRAQEEVTALNAELREKVKLLGRANADLEEFTFAASHDLREPLRLMVSYSQLLLRRREGSTDPVEREYAEYLRASADRMRGLIDGLLNYSRVAHDSADAPTHSDAAAVAQEAVRLFADVILESGATVRIDPLPAVAVGATPLLQLFQNLIGNALKYRKAGEQPRIHISAVEAGGEICFAVRDNGIGIEPEFHHQIFGLFKRLHGNKYPGLGIGLASCKRVAEHCGGRIWLESKPGAGSTFYVALPAVGAASRIAAGGSVA